jgi:uncharacterized protein (DUF433 family)
MLRPVIISTPCTLAGKPRVNGTRLSVEFIAARLADGWSYEQVLSAYPALTLSDIQAVIAYKPILESAL